MCMHERLPCLQSHLACMIYASPPSRFHLDGLNFHLKKSSHSINTLNGSPFELIFHTNPPSWQTFFFDIFHRNLLCAILRHSSISPRTWKFQNSIKHITPLGGFSKPGGRLIDISVMKAEFVFVNENSIKKVKNKKNLHLSSAFCLFQVLCRKCKRRRD